MIEIVLIIHNIRSTHNVGSLLRTAEGLGVNRVVLSGYTPHPERPQDPRLPHEIQKTTKQIHKTALGAQTMVRWEYHHDIAPVIKRLKKNGYTIAAIEQTPDARPLPLYHPPGKIVIIVGREVEGIEKEVLDSCDVALEIPMFGKKESFNVAQAAAIALYHCRFTR